MNDAYFYYPSLNETEPAVTLTGDEARHLSGARRLRPGERVTLFNGQGLLATAEILALHDRGRTADLRILDASRIPARQPGLHLACALPKGDRLATLLDMGTQLGMTSFTPLQCSHAVVKPSATSLERWQRICLEACKQSRRAWLPRINAAATPDDVVRAALVTGGQAWVAHPGGQPLDRVLPGKNHDQWFLVGPEGGFTDEEVDRAVAAGALWVGLGREILRIETAAVALLATARLGARAE